MISNIFLFSSIVDLIYLSFKKMSEQMDASNNDASSSNSTIKLAIKTPKEKKDVSIDASSTVKQVRFLIKKSYS